ncbi:MAG: uroporphyrinogen-III C-methyltransferase [Methylococcaceae bacterium]|nr:uroporphyrinogen-III C-methyltransferase [Methylococcaceae bacterium]
MKNNKDQGNLYGVLILLIVILIAAAGYIFLQQLRSEQEGLGGALNRGDQRIGVLHDQLASLESQMSTLQQQIGTMQNLLETRESKFERELADFKEHHGNQLSSTKAELSASINNIQDLLNKTRGDWMISDAEYLMGVAIHRLNLAGDIKTSLVALSAADERLRDSGNPGVFKVREQVAREIDSLKKVKPLDVVGMFSKIRILEDQVATLPTLLPHSGVVQEQFKPEIPENKAKDISGVNDLIDAAIKDLKGLVEIRRSERPIITVLQPEEVRIIREELKIKLEFARLALVERDSKLFLHNIEETKIWLKANFRLDAAETKKFEEELQSLETVGLDLVYPDISGSLKLLQNLAWLRVERDQATGAKVVPRVGSEPARTEIRDRKSEGGR